MLRPLSITPNGEAYLVGDLVRGEFIEVPPVAVTVIRALQAGRSLAETATAARVETGQEVDVADFVQTLTGCGFVAAIDGVPVQADGPELMDWGRAGAALARLGRPLYSAPAWACYAGLFVCCLVVVIAVPWLRPRYGQLFFLANPVLSAGLLGVITVPLLMLHEVAHWLGGRIEGIPARITLSRRYYLMVAQTDLSAIWSLPRRRRYGPLLAGMAFDTVVTAALLGARGGEHLAWWHLQPTLSRLLAALVVVQAGSLGFQFVLFLRTDLYAVLITALGCINLTRISRLQLIRVYRRLSAAEDREFAAASQRDKDTSRWYCWVQLGGAAVAAWYFVVFFAPAVLHSVRWIGSGLSRSSPSAAEFWYMAGSGCVALLPVVIPPLTYLRDRSRRRRPAGAGQRPTTCQRKASAH